MCSIEQAGSRRFRCKAAYDGSGYAGWQFQPDVRTVQGEIETALARVTGEQTRVSGAGRTDTGVHSVGQVAHWDSCTSLDVPELERALNAVLDKDIRLYDLQAVPAEFHARYSAIRREYRYYLTDSGRPDSVLKRRHAWLFPLESLDPEILDRAAACLDGELDFSAFSKTGTVTRSNLCRIDLSVWEREEAEMTFTIRADRFLRGMVRMLVGGMVAVAANHAGLEEFRAALREKRHWKPAMPAPARGLTLMRVEYPEPFVY